MRNIYNNYFPKAKGLWHFASRCNDSFKGSDIDLFVELIKMNKKSC